MKKQLTVRIPDVDGEEGLSQACRNGNLFRNDAQLVNLYKEGFRIYNYSIVDDSKSKNPSKLQTLVKVFLKK